MNKDFIRTKSECLCARTKKDIIAQEFVMYQKEEEEIGSFLNLFPYVEYKQTYD